MVYLIIIKDLLYRELKQTPEIDKQTSDRYKNETFKSSDENMV